MTARLAPGAGLGAALGVVGALALTRMMANQLLRATRLDPARVLREE